MLQILGLCRVSVQKALSSRIYAHATQACTSMALLSGQRQIFCDDFRLGVVAEYGSDVFLRNSVLAVDGSWMIMIWLGNIAYNKSICSNISRLHSAELARETKPSCLYRFYIDDGWQSYHLGFNTGIRAWYRKTSNNLYFQVALRFTHTDCLYSEIRTITIHMLLKYKYPDASASLWVKKPSSSVKNYGLLVQQLLSMISTAWRTATAPHTSPSPRTFSYTLPCAPVTPLAPFSASSAHHPRAFSDLLHTITRFTDLSNLTISILSTFWLWHWLRWW